MQNKEISKALLGSTETTESSDSSGYAQSKTHGEQDSKKFDSDLNFVRRVLNSRFVKILEAHGFNTEGGKFVIQGEETELSTTETFNIYKGLKDTFDLPFEDDTLYEVFGVQKPDNYDSLKKEQLEAAKTKDPLEISPGNSDPTKKDPKKKKDTPEEKEVKLAMATTEEETTAVEKIKNLVDKYIKNLKELFLTAPTETIGATNGNRHIVNLAFNSDFDNEALIQRIWDAEGKSNFDATLFQHTLNTLLSAFKQGWDTNSKKVDLAFNTSFEYGVDDPAMLTAFELNLFKFTGGKDLALVNKLNQLFRESKSFEEFYQKASKQAEIFNKHWLETEYNTAVLSGEAAANYTRLQKVAHIFPYWKYVTAGDEHVRRSHQPLEGLILPANDKRWLKIFPPNGWNCRCYIVPVMKHEFDESQLKKMRSKADKYIKSPAFAKEKTQGFGINRGETGEVFTQNQLYINKMAGLGNKQLNNLSAANWGLPQFNSAQNVATEPIDTYTGTTDKWLAKNNTLRDYNNRQLAIEKTDFIRLINGAKEDKRLLLNAVVATLNNADEVWLSGKELQEILYVKYYQGNTFLVSSILNNFSLALTDFKTVANAETYRRGLLMFAKSS